MVLPQPITHIRRKKKRLLTIAHQEVHSHALKCLNHTRQTRGLRDTHDGKRKTRRTYDGPVPYDLRHSFASLLIHEGKHSIVQIAEWMGHSPATLLAHYAHVIADVAGKSTLPSEQAIKAARGTPPYRPSNSTTGYGHRVVTQWCYS